jgi:molybdopterin-guanine dinucleotide biosynthesis protein A
MLTDDNWRLQDLSKRINARILKFSELANFTNAENLFLNINTPEDYQAAIAIDAKM